MPRSPAAVAAVLLAAAAVLAALVAVPAAAAVGPERPRGAPRGAARGANPDDAQLAALEALFVATRGLQWLDRTGWLTPQPPCSWYGVACSASGDVVSLSLPANNLVGPLPDELWALSQLAVLDLADNLLSGTLSPLMAGVPLTSLMLAENIFSGALPDALSSAQLSVVSLGSPALSGTLPPSLFSPALVELRVTGSQISGTLPLDMPMPLLQIVSCQSNRLSGRLPADLQNIFRLELADNLFSGPLPVEVAPLRGSWRLDNNAFTGTVPEGPLWNLFVIAAPDNALTGSLPAVTGNFGSLDLSRNALTGTIPPGLSGDIDFISHFMLASNLLSGPIPTDSLARMPRLLILDLSDNVLTGPLPRLSAAERPQLMLLSDNALSGPLFDEIGGQAIDTVDVSSNALTGPLSATVGALLVAENFLLGSNMLTGTLSSRFLNAPSFLVDVSNNGLGGAIPSGDSQSPLQELRAEGNMFEGTLPVTFAAMGALRRLNVAHNALTALPSAAWMAIFPTNFLAPEDFYREESALEMFPSLDTLRLDGNPLDTTVGRLLQMVAAWQSLAVLTCVDCPIGGDLTELAVPYQILHPLEYPLQTPPPFVRLLQIDFSGIPGLGGKLPTDIPVALLLFSASSTGLGQAVPAPWLQLSLLALDGTDTFWDGDFESVVDLAEAPTSFGSYRCLEALGRGARVLRVDPRFLDYRACVCEDGHFGVPPDCAGCPADTYQGASFNTTACRACPPNSSTRGATLVGTVDGCLCNAGFVPSASGSGDCEPCPAGRFAPQVGAVSCAVCPDGSYSSPGATECFACPAPGTVCVGGTLAVQPGFWRAQSDEPVSAATQFSACVPADVCRVAADGMSQLCRDGHTGVLCAECAPGHGRYDGRCVECLSDGASTTLVVVAAAVFGGLMAFIVWKSARGRSTTSVILKIISNHVQCMLIILRFGWKAPAIFDAAVRVTATATGSDLFLSALFPLQCAASTTYHEEQAISLALPIMTVALAWSLLGLAVAAGRQSAQSAVSYGATATVVILFQLHSVVMRRVASFFECESVAGVERHIEDFGTPCEGATYDAVLAANVLGLLVFVMGVPVVGMLLLARASSQQMLSDQRTARGIGFLFVGYRLPGDGAAKGTPIVELAAAPAVGNDSRNLPRFGDSREGTIDRIDSRDLESAAGSERGGARPAPAAPAPAALAAPFEMLSAFPTHYWEGVLLVRKIALVGCATFLGPVARPSADMSAESDQSAVGLTILLAAGFLHCAVQPFDRWQLNWLETVSIAALATSLDAGISQGRDRDLVAGIAATLHLVFLIACAAYIANRRFGRRIWPRRGGA